MATSTKHQDKLELLRDILMPEEHKALEELSRRVIELEKQGREQRELLKHLQQTIDKKLEDHKTEMLKILDSGPLDTLKKEIDRNPEAAAEMLAPLTSNLLKKHRVEKKKNLRYGLSSPFRSIARSWKALTKRKAPSSETRKADKQLRSVVVEQLFLIDRKSHNLKASFPENNVIDEAKISVICGLINDHIQKHDLGQDQHLTRLIHGPYQIYIHGFIKHFVALVIRGKKELDCMEKLQDIVFSFYYQYLSDNLDLLEEPKKDTFQKKIIDRRILERTIEKNFRIDSP